MLEFLSLPLKVPVLPATFSEASLLPDAVPRFDKPVDIRTLIRAMTAPAQA